VLEVEAGGFFLKDLLDLLTLQSFAVAQGFVSFLQLRFLVVG
jgi:hypothetical protein